MSEDNQIFRKKALDKLSSPEQLDVLMQVTAPVGWLALLSLTAVTGVILLWSIFGIIPEKVQGKGILIKGAAVLSVSSTTSGQVEKLTVSQGDTVKKGQVIAYISQGLLDRQIKNKQTEVQAAEQQHDDQNRREARGRRLSANALHDETRSLKASTANLRRQLGSIKQKVVAQKKLLEKGLVTRSSVLEVEKELSATQNRIEQNNVRKAQIKSKLADLERGLTEAGVRRENIISGLKRELKDLEINKQSSSQVVSPYDGRVLERMVGPGNLVQPNTQLLTLETMDKALDVVVYIPAGDGKKVQIGMDVRVSPSTVKAEEFGFMLGKVESVSNFPSTPEGMRRVLQNESLVRELIGESAPIKIIVSLGIDSSTPSGFTWSSSKGPNVGVFSGTPCNAFIIVRKKKPIGMVIPLFRESLGI